MPVVPRVDEPRSNRKSKRGESSVPPPPEDDGYPYGGEDMLFYFSKDVNVTKLKFFDTEIDENLKRAILWKYDIRDEGVDPAFQRSDQYKSVQSEVDFLVKRRPLDPLCDDLVLQETIKARTPIPPVPRKPRINMVKFREWKEKKERREQFELKMVAFLAILDHKIAQKEAF